MLTKLISTFSISYWFAVFQDVHVMMLVGFGYLMTFLGKHGFGSVGFNFLLTCFVIEWSILVNGWFAMVAKGLPDIGINIFRYDKTEL